MTTSNRTLLVAALCALAAAATAGSAAAQAPAPAAGDAAKGRDKVAMCQGCHGIDGWRTAFPEVYSVPKIAGQQPAYIVSALKAYRSGDRAHPSMRAIAAQLSDADIANVAAYYGELGLRTAVK
jgi:cytochrome c553